MTQVENLMQKLKCSEAEAKDIIEADRRIDKGEKLFELSADQEKASKQARKAERAPTTYKFQKKERKADSDKRTIINTLVSAVSGEADGEISLENPEREFSFMYHGKKYKVVLSCPRS